MNVITVTFDQINVSLLNRSFFKKRNCTALIEIRNVCCAANQHIRMISEGSCDTEDLRNDAENSALHHSNKLHFNIYYTRKNIWNWCSNISQYYCYHIFQCACSHLLLNNEHQFILDAFICMSVPKNVYAWGNYDKRICPQLPDTTPI